MPPAPNGNLRPCPRCSAPFLGCGMVGCGFQQEQDSGDRTDSEPRKRGTARLAPEECIAGRNPGRGGFEQAAEQERRPGAGRTSSDSGRRKCDVLGCSRQTQTISSKSIVATPPIPGAYLAGGTALALQYGHRLSEDSTGFCPKASTPGNCPPFSNPSGQSPWRRPTPELSTDGSTEYR